MHTALTLVSLIAGAAFITACCLGLYAAVRGYRTRDLGSVTSAARWAVIAVALALLALLANALDADWADTAMWGFTSLVATGVLWFRVKTHRARWAALAARADSSRRDW